MCVCVCVWELMRIQVGVCQPGQPAQHLLGCVCAELCEGLEPKALTRHYTADKAICDGGPTRIPGSAPHAGKRRSRSLFNMPELRVTALTSMFGAVG